MKDTILFLDTGIDDAAALTLALFDKKIKIKAIVASGGNLSPKQVATNTIHILEFFGKDIPVFLGSNDRRSKKEFNVFGVHCGRDGMGGYKFKKIEQKPKTFDEFLSFYDTLGNVNIICLSPMTDLATLIQKKDTDKMKQITIEAGLLADPKYSAFNVAFDEVAARFVIQSGVKIVVCPSDMGHSAYLDKDDVAHLKTMGKTGEMLEYIFRKYKDRVVQNNVATHDACAVFCQTHKRCFEFKKVSLKVTSKKEYGVLKFDFDAKTKTSKVCTKMNIAKFKKYFFDKVQKSNESID